MPSLNFLVVSMHFSSTLDSLVNARIVPAVSGICDLLIPMCPLSSLHKIMSQNLHRIRSALLQRKVASLTVRTSFKRPVWMKGG